MVARGRDEATPIEEAGERGEAQATRGVLARYLTVATLARLADDGTRVALALLALAQTDSAAFGGALVAALLIPHVVAAPVIGGIADRVRHRRPFHAAALALFGAALIGCGLLVGRAPGPLVLAIAVAGGCCGPLVTGGLTSLLGDLIPGEGRDRAYSLDISSYNIAGIVGPALAAIIATAVGPRAATLALAVGALLAALLLCTLPIRPRERGGERAPSLLLGVAALWHDGTLRATTIASSIGHVGAGALPIVAVALGARYAAPALSGAFISASAIGGLLGSLGYARWPFGAAHPERVVIGCLVGTALALALVPAVPAVAASFILLGLAGMCGSPLGSSLFQVRERRAPATVRTQVFALGGGLKYAAAALGAAVSGAWIGLGSGPLFLAIAGCGALGAGIGALLLRADNGGQREHGDAHFRSVRESRGGVDA